INHPTEGGRINYMRGVVTYSLAQTRINPFVNTKRILKSSLSRCPYYFLKFYPFVVMTFYTFRFFSQLIYDDERSRE
ncbi:MAG: hypothetical protein MHMPM18_004036, partial [Marteilia pararefringens]